MKINKSNNQEINDKKKSDTSKNISHEIFKDNFPNLDIPEFFKQIASNAQIAGILIMDKQGIIRAMNMGMQQGYGYTSDELIGKNFSLLFLEEDRAKNLPEREITTVLQKGSVKDENYCVHKDGSYIWTLGESIFAKNKKGEIFIVKFIFDINNQKLLEEHLIDSNNRLSQVNKDLETFVYAASHDLKAPIGNIEALIDTLYQELLPGCKNVDSINEIFNMLKVSTKKFQTVISDLAVVGKVHEAEKEDGVSEILFSELLGDVKTILQPQIAESQAILIEDFSKLQSVRFSRKNMRSIFHNLISNAIKYRHPGRKPYIKISTEKVGEYILFKVCDNGLGIKEEDKEKIFSMYKRMYNHVEGTGVGMSIVAMIVNNNGGKIEVDSKPGEGTTFKIYLIE